MKIKKSKLGWSKKGKKKKKLNKNNLKNKNKLTMQPLKQKN